MNSPLPLWDRGYRLTVGSGGVTESYAVKLNSSGEAVAMNDTDDIAIGIADSTQSAAAQVTVYPLTPGVPVWVNVSGAVTVGAKMVLDPATGRFSASTSTGALVHGICLQASAGAGSTGFALMMPVFAGLTNIAE